MILLATAALLAQEIASPRAWLSDDPLVQFQDGARFGAIMPSSRNVGEYQVVVVCKVGSDLLLSDCESARVTPEDRGLRRDGARAVQHVQLKDVSGGPRQGDSVVFDFRVQTTIRTEAWP